MDEDFLLTTDSAARLYRDFAEPMPIYDYHNHLSAGEIFRNHRYENVGRLMLGGDHYKWRLMLADGADDGLIYRPTDDFAAFRAYAAALSRAPGNPLYHWTHLELKRAFGIDEVLNERSAPSVWERANEALAKDEYRCRGLIERFGVRVLCTTDDPVDDLDAHRALAAEDGFAPKVLPTFRPDRALGIEKP
ncbi:MAG: glucuronate isomerase, partial [Promicromonosporaceae bacterium]|nr:glucuronate isomerase [Promicromonosporaceae bacterium]